MQKQKKRSSTSGANFPASAVNNFQFQYSRRITAQQHVVLPIEVYPEECQTKFERLWVLSLALAHWGCQKGLSCMVTEVDLVAITQPVEGVGP